MQHECLWDELAKTFDVDVWCANLRPEEKIAP